MSVRLKWFLIGALCLAVGIVAGAAIASAATPTTTATTAATAAATTPSAPTATSSPFPAHGTNAHEDAETPVTGAAASKAQAAAVKAAGGGTAGAVTTDFRGNGYEVTVKKSDGSTVEIHLDSSFNVLQCPGGRGGSGY